MDEVDFRLCLTLLKNSRTVYRELADKVELSVNAVHNRIKNLIDNGIIEKFCANLGIKALEGSLKILIHGGSKFEVLDEVVEELSQDERTFKMISTSDDYLYIYGLLSEISEMSRYVETIPEIAEIEEPEIFLPNVSGKNTNQDFEFIKTDYRIVHSLHDDSRKSLSKVADELSVSTKTVRRRIDKMERAGAIDYSIRWYPVHSDDFIGLLHGKITEGRRDQKLSDIKNEYSPRVFDVEKASNHPDKVFIKIWGNSLDKIKMIKNELRSTEYFNSLKNRMFYDIKYFSTWRDDLLEKKAKG